MKPRVLPDERSRGSRRRRGIVPCPPVTYAQASTRERGRVQRGRCTAPGRARDVPSNPTDVFALPASAPGCAERRRVDVRAGAAVAARIRRRRPARLAEAPVRRAASRRAPPGRTGRPRADAGREPRQATADHAAVEVRPGRRRAAVGVRVRLSPHAARCRRSARRARTRRRCPGRSGTTDRAPAPAGRGR